MLVLQKHFMDLAGNKYWQLFREVNINSCLMLDNIAKILQTVETRVNKRTIQRCPNKNDLYGYRTSTKSSSQTK